MSLALLAAAGAAVLWPDGRALLRRRLRVVAGVPRPPGRPVPLPLLAAAGLGALGAVLSTPLVALLAAGGGALSARAWASRRVAASEETRLVALAEALGALAAELRAGRSLEDAVRGAAAACPDRHCAAALVSVLRAPPAGPRDALAAELGRLSAAVALSARTGCSLATVVVAVEDDLRARLGHRRALRVATAGPRASARLLAGLPVLGLAMGSGIGADPWRVLTTTGPGQVLLVVGVLLEAAGIAWTGRLMHRIGR
ncbi:pilus assembly protein TadB [Blastococcus montanus]|uniref:type II secretion system F family protein n=1 Tax=Blastococcus montanus TaxID=3144973 RepID=UPI00320B0A05